MARWHLHRYSVFKDAGADVLGISSDAPETNAQFAKAQRLPFPLLSDTGSEFRKALGVSGDLFGLLPGRQARPLESSMTHFMAEASSARVCIITGMPLPSVKAPKSMGHQAETDINVCADFHLRQGGQSCNGVPVTAQG